MEVLRRNGAGYNRSIDSLRSQRYPNEERVQPRQWFHWLQTFSLLVFSAQRRHGSRIASYGIQLAAMAELVYDLAKAGGVDLDITRNVFGKCELVNF